VDAHPGNAHRCGDLCGGDGLYQSAHCLQSLQAAVSDITHIGNIGGGKSGIATYVDADADIDTDGNANTHADANEYSDADAHINEHAHGVANRNRATADADCGAIASIIVFSAATL
jgi:hypothetical protein